MKLTSRKVVFVLLAIVALGIRSKAQVLTNVYSFSNVDGYDPLAPLVQGVDGNFYGTTAFGGAMGFGTAFNVSPTGVLTTLHSFCSPAGCYADGSFPYGGLVQAANGNFYGTADEGGAYSAGSAYQIGPTGDFKLIYSFCAPLNCYEGEYPNAGLAIGIDGDLYGATSFSNDGTLFKINSKGKLTILVAFTGANGSTPQAAMTLGANGMFYGTTEYGGQYPSWGTVYKMTPSGALTTLYSFCSRTSCDDGTLPLSKVVQASNGNLYGTTYEGGTHSCGTVFQLTPAGVLTTLHSFTCAADGMYPNAPLIQATDGNLYGTASTGGSNDNGTLFEINRAGQFILIHEFNGTDGMGPAGLVQGTDGAIYGSTGGGGSGQYGTIFKLDLGLGPFVGFVQPFGRLGETASIIGQGLTGTASVVLNGVPAVFTVVSDTQIQVTVPEGATTGFVKVTTPVGILTSNVPFHVIP